MIHLNSWEDMARNRTGWGSEIGTGIKVFDMQTLMDINTTRQAKKNTQNTNTLMAQCHVCDQICASNFRLRSHICHMHCGSHCQIDGQPTKTTIGSSLRVNNNNENLI